MSFSQKGDVDFCISHRNISSDIWTIELSESGGVVKYKFVNIKMSSDGPFCSRYQRLQPLPPLTGTKCIQIFNQQVVSTTKHATGMRLLSKRIIPLLYSLKLMGQSVPDCTIYRTVYDHIWEYIIWGESRVIAVWCRKVRFGHRLALSSCQMITWMEQWQ